MPKKVNLPVVNPLIQDDKRKYLFIPCKSKEELKNWIYVYLGLDYPDGRVDPSSNSDPMSLVWELYSAATNTERRWERLLGYASRFSFKTLSAAVLELLFLVHHGRDISHMSAIESQAANCVQYIKKFLNLPIFSGFISKDNTRELFFTRFFDPVTNMSFTEKEVSFLAPEIKKRLLNYTNSMKIIVATTASANGLHTNLTCLDGNTKILTRNTQISTSNRDRISWTAKGLFKKLNNENQTGRHGGETELYLNSVKKDIELLTVNEITGEFEFKPILQAQRKKSERIKLTFDNGKELICTKDHKIFTVNGKIEADELSVEDKIINILKPKTIRQGMVVVKSKYNQTYYTKLVKKEVLDNDWVYDFTVKDNHNFFANGVLVKNCLDEIDLIANKEAYAEAKMIPTETNGFAPITFLTSTRKYSIGLVQKEIDDATETGLEIRHWNILDVTERSVDQDTILFTTDNKPKKIKDFQIGDKLWGVNDNGETIETSVVGVYDHGTIEGIEVEFDDGYKITCSEDHKFLTKFGQMAIKDIIKQNIGVLSEKSTYKQTFPKWMANEVWPVSKKPTFNGRSQSDLSSVLRTKKLSQKAQNLDSTLRSNLSCKKGNGRTQSSMRRMSNNPQGTDFQINEETSQRKSPTVHGYSFKSQCRICQLAERTSRSGGGSLFGTVRSSKTMVFGKSRKSYYKHKKTSSSQYSVDQRSSRGSRSTHKEDDVCTQEQLKIRGMSSDFWNLKLGGCSDSMRREAETSGFRFSKSQDLGGSGRLSSFLCPRERQDRYKKEVGSSSKQRQYVVSGGSEKNGRYVDSAGNGSIPQAKWTNCFERRLEELAFAHAPLSDTRSLSLRQIVQVRSVGKRRMYDLGVSHNKHNFILPNGLVTSNCTPARHQPDKPKVVIYRSQKLLKAISEESYERLDIANKEKYVKDEGYWGCLNNCSLFAACKGYLTEQTCRSPMLKSIPHIQSQMKINDPEKANAQLLCNKPSKEGMIYPYLDPEVHFKTPAQIATMITGDEFSENFTYNQLISLAQSLDCRFVTGMDHGYTHNFAVCTGFIYGNKLFMIDAFAVPELEIGQKINLCNDRIKHLNPTIYPDPEDPGARKSFNMHGFKCKEFKKGKGSVLEGIEACRMKIQPSLGRDPEVYFVKDNDGVLSLFNDLTKYHWIVGSDEKPTDVPSDDNDDQCFTKEMEVLTVNGWKSIKDVTLSDTVCAVTEDGKDVWEKPLKIINKEYTGDLVKINHSHMEFTATRDHRHAVMTQTNWKIKHNYKLQKMSYDEMHQQMYWANNLSKWQEGPGLFLQGADEAWLAGFWLAEGCFDTSRPTFLLFDQKKPQHQKTFREKCKVLGWKWSETIRKDGGGIRFVISEQGSRRNDWLNRFGSGAANKKVELADLLQMSQSEREALWEGYMCGDGSRTQSAWHYDSISPKLMDSMQILSLMLGYGCRIVSYDCMKAGRIMPKLPGHTKQYFSSKIYRAHVLRKKPVAHIQKKDFEILPNQKTQVYCIRTSTGYFLGRQNGKILVSGQCDALRYLIMNEFPLKNRANNIMGETPNKETKPKEEVQGMTAENFVTQHLIDLGIQRSSEEFETPDKSKKSGIKWII